MLKNIIINPQVYRVVKGASKTLLGTVENIDDTDKYFYIDPKFYPTEIDFYIPEIQFNYLYGYGMPSRDCLPVIVTTTLGNNIKINTEVYPILDSNVAYSSSNHHLVFSTYIKRDERLKEVDKYLTTDNNTAIIITAEFPNAVIHTLQGSKAFIFGYYDLNDSEFL